MSDRLSPPELYSLVYQAAGAAFVAGTKPLDAVDAVMRAHGFTDPPHGFKVNTETMCGARDSLAREAFNQGYDRIQEGRETVSGTAQPQEASVRS